MSVEQTGDEDTAVVLGKYLSPKLFVSYGISIVEAINTIKLRYTLNERWSLKAEAGRVIARPALAAAILRELETYVPLIQQGKGAEVLSA